MNSLGKMLFITSAHPGGAGVIGAGEGICESNLRGLVKNGYEVHVICFASSDQASNPEVVALCASYTTLVHSPGQSLLAMWKCLRKGSLVAPWLFTRVSPRNVRAVRAALAQHVIRKVWIDFPSSLGFAALLPGCEVEYFAHDVVSQKVGRKWLLSVLQPLVMRIERSLLSAVKRCWVLSEKDAGLLRALEFGGEIVVSPPQHLKVGFVANTTAVTTILPKFSEGLNLVFFGSMRRAENHWSMMYFLLFVYPTIRRAHPRARLWILGLEPRRLLRWVARRVGGTEIVGAVDDPAQAFAKATLCIAPLRYGAGVKIKVLQMLEAGARVLATPIGAEGIAPNDHLMVVNERDFAKAVIAELGTARSSLAIATSPD